MQHPCREDFQMGTMESMFATHGFPAQLVTDNRICFTSEEFQNFCNKNDIYHITSAPVQSSTNGLAERNVQTFKNSWKNMDKSQSVKCIGSLDFTREIWKRVNKSQEYRGRNKGWPTGLGPVDSTSGQLGPHLADPPGQ